MRTSLPFLGLLLATAAQAQSVLAPFNSYYEAVALGQMPGIYNYGGITFAPGNPNVLLISPYQSGQVRAVSLVRDSQGFITGFSGSAPYATVGGTDGGLAFGPGGVLFFTWYGPNRLGQILPGGTTASRVDDLQPLGIYGSVGSCAFVPAGRGGAGRFKIVSYASGKWYDVALAADGAGTFQLQNVTEAATVQNGPEGILYPASTSPLLGNHVLVAEWNAGLAAYQTDANGDPLPMTRQVVMTGFSGNAGGAIDPVTGDMLFSGNGGRLVAVRLGATCGSITSYGPASPGSTVTPTLLGTGCARLAQSVTLQVDGAPFSLGILALGYYPVNVPFAGLTLLTTISVTVTSVLDATGRFVLPLAIPNTPSLGNTHLYFQAGLLDAGTPSGLSATAGLDVLIR